MLNFAMVLMILAGIFGLPAAACSTVCAGACAGMATVAANDPNARDSDKGGAAALAAYGGVFMALAAIASIGSIVIGALVRKIGKVPAAISALAFALLFVLQLLMANPLGIPSAIMLLVAAVMIFVAPQPEYTGVSKVEVAR